MKYQTKVKKIGDSFHILIPKNIKKDLQLLEGDEVAVIISRNLNIKEKEENRWKSYKCLICDHKFSSNDDIIYCSACDNEDNEKIEEIEDD